MASASHMITNLAQNIKTIRHNMGFSQDRLSKVADIAYNTLIKIESGTIKNPTIKTLFKIAKALNTKVDNLIK